MSNIFDSVNHNHHIKEFDNRVISKIHSGIESENLTSNLADILAYINRWSPYINARIVNRDVVFQALQPYLLYLQNMLKPMVIDCYYHNYSYISGYMKMMEYYFPRYKQDLGLTR